MTDKPPCTHARQKLYRGELSCCDCGAPMPIPLWMARAGVKRDNVYHLVRLIDNSDAVKTDGYTRQTITWQAPTASWLGSELSPLVPGEPGEPCAECEAEETHDAFLQCANELCNARVPCNLGDTELVCPRCSSRMAVEDGVKMNLVEV